MKIELIRQKFNGTRGYKIKSMDWCCEKIKDNPVIDLFDKTCEGKEKGMEDVPAVMIYTTEIINSWGDEFEQENLYPISYCPYCAEKIEISVVKEQDVSEGYDKLTNLRESLWDKRKKTDSKTEEAALYQQIQELDKKINDFYILLFDDLGE